jgi:hypothetical protein
VSDLNARYYAALADPEQVRREVARRQLGRLERRALSSSKGARRPSRWQYVPLDTLFAEQGNALHVRSDGQVESGHEPLHHSKSGRCVLIDPREGRWWCRSCRRSGDAAQFLMDILGCRYARAAATLTRRFGPPVTPASPPLHQASPRRTVEVPVP